MKATYYLFGLVGLALAACAAYVSVTGWAEVFAGSAATVTVIMAVIEAGKIVAASLAYRLREVAPKPLTVLLVATTVVTMALTSMGIYGFLSKAYQTSASQVAQKEAKVEALQREKKQFQRRAETVKENRNRLSKRLDQAQDRVQALTEQYRDRGWATDKQALEDAQNTVQEMRNRLSSRAQLSMTLNDSLSSVSRKLTTLQTTSTDAEAKLSAVQFAADIFGYSRQAVANIFILAIVFVFDPAAVAIIIATNVAAEKSGQGGFFEETITEPDTEELYDQAREAYQKAASEDEAEQVEESAGERDESLPEGEPNKSMGEKMREIRDRELKNMPETDFSAASEVVRKRKSEVKEEEEEEEIEPAPASFHLISWLQRESENILRTRPDWDVVKEVGGDIEDFVDVIDPSGVSLPSDMPTFTEGEVEADDAENYIEHELRELNNPDKIRREVDRLMSENRGSDNRYIIKANGGVDHDPSREA